MTKVEQGVKNQGLSSTNYTMRIGKMISMLLTILFAAQYHLLEILFYKVLISPTAITCILCI